MQRMLVGGAVYRMAEHGTRLSGMPAFGDHHGIVGEGTAMVDGEE